MATFLKIGDKIINLDLVTDMKISDKQITVYFSAPSGDKDRSHARLCVLRDEEATVMQKWITENATDLGVEVKPKTAKPKLDFF